MQKKISHHSALLFENEKAICTQKMPPKLLECVLSRVEQFREQFGSLENIEQFLSPSSLHQLVITSTDPDIAQEIEKMMDVLCNGSGVLHVSDFPTSDDLEANKLVFLVFSCLLGYPSYANRDNKLIWPVINRQIDASNNQQGHVLLRFGNSSRGLKFHTDTSTLAALFCLRPAEFGGENELLSTVMVHNYLLTYNPDALKILYRPVLVDRRGEQKNGQSPYASLPVFGVGKNGSLMTHWAADYHYTVFENGEVDSPGMPPEIAKAYEAMEEAILEISKRYPCRIKLNAGEILILNNNLCLHNRTSYQDCKRAMLRSWVYLPRYESFEHMFGYSYL